MGTQRKVPAIAEIRLSYKNPVKSSQRVKINGNSHAAKVLKSCWDMGKIELVEQFRILLLNTANEVLGSFEVSSGSGTQTIVDHRLIFVSALKANARSIILAHNHPSGNLTASKSDINLTERLRLGAKLLGMDVIDHIILSREAYFSFAEQGLL